MGGSFSDPQPDTVLHNFARWAGTSWNTVAPGESHRSFLDVVGRSGATLHSTISGISSSLTAIISSDLPTFSYYAVEKRTLHHYPERGEYSVTISGRDSAVLDFIVIPEG